MNKPLIAKCHDCGLPTDGECLSLQSTNGETVTWNCGCVDGIDSQGIIQTEPMPVVDRDPINRLLADEKEYDPTWNGFKKDVTPEDIKGLVLSCIGMLFLIAIFAAAEVTK